MTAKPEPLMTEADVSAYLTVPRPTLKDWRYHGTGPTFIRVGHHVRYRPADLRAWLKQHEVGAA